MLAPELFQGIRLKQGPHLDTVVYVDRALGIIDQLRGVVVERLLGVAEEGRRGDAVAVGHSGLLVQIQQLLIFLYGVLEGTGHDLGFTLSAAVDHLQQLQLLLRGQLVALGPQSVYKEILDPLGKVPVNHLRCLLVVDGSVRVERRQNLIHNSRNEMSHRNYLLFSLKFSL